METNDPSDPVARAYRKLFRKIRNLLLLLVGVVVVFVLFGVPSIQGDYRCPSQMKSTPSAMDKLDAEYWNPMSGWKTIRAGELAPGCPIVVFMPLRECMALSPYKNVVTTRLFGEEFFDGP